MHSDRLQRKGFILLTSVGLSTLIIIYTLGVLPMKQQMLLTVREERERLDRQAKWGQFEVDALLEKHD